MERMCKTCNFLNIDGVCIKYRQHIPIEIVDKPNDCKKYKPSKETKQ